MLDIDHRGAGEIALHRGNASVLNAPGPIPADLYQSRSVKRRNAPTRLNRLNGPASPSFDRLTLQAFFQDQVHHGLLALVGAHAVIFLEVIGDPDDPARPALVLAFAPGMR